MSYTVDFETTTDEEDCRVWAWGVCDIETERFEYGNSIEGFIEFCMNSGNETFYFHNLRFDAEFIFVWLFENGYKHITDRRDEESKTFSTLISDKGQFYSLKIIFEKKNKTTKKVTIYDSLKLLPFKVSEIAKGFDLPISKLEINYKEKREKGHILTQQEVDYLRNDVVIVAKALKVLFEQGMNKMTLGSNALAEYKRIIGEKTFSRWFPPPEYDKDVRQCYKGGFTYVNPKFKNKVFGSGLVFDVNSLYPWVLYECLLPYGEPIFFDGQYKQDDLYPLYVQMLTCEFEIKPNHIPTIQLKNNLLFVPTQYIISSQGEEVTLCLTSVDLELFFEHYDVTNITWHSGYKFKATTGLFKDYITKWNNVKMQATIDKNKALRTIAKLMLNNIYGKFSSNPIVCSKLPFYDDGVIKYKLGEKEERKPIYIPVGAFVTAWARHKTITSAQKMYKYFAYADTDSLHLVLNLPDDILIMNGDDLEKLTTKDLINYGLDIPEDFDIDPLRLGAWKIESKFTRAKWLRQKCYMEDDNPRETWGTEQYNKGLLNITCAGMPDACYPFVTWENFKFGAKYQGKLQPKHVKGGLILRDVEYTIKKG